MLPVAAGSSALVAAILVWWTLGPSAARSNEAPDDEVRAEAAPALVLEADLPELSPPAATEAAAAAQPVAPAADEPELVLEPDPVDAEAESDPVMTFAPEKAPPAGGGGGGAAARPAKPRGKGFFTIDSMPYATVYVDGAKKGVTPLLRLQLPAGKHEVLAVTADGRRQKFQVTIEPGEEARRRKLTW